MIEPLHESTEGSPNETKQVITFFILVGILFALIVLWGLVRTEPLSPTTVEAPPVPEKPQEIAKKVEEPIQKLPEKKEIKKPEVIIEEIAKVEKASPTVALISTPSITPVSPLPLVELPPKPKPTPVPVPAPIPKPKEVIKEVAVEVKEPEKPKQKNIGALTLSAKSAVVYDIAQNRFLFEKNADTPLPLASITKVMTAITARELIPELAVVTIRDGSLALDGDSGLVKNEKWSFKKLLNFTLLSSSNDGANAIAQATESVAKREVGEETTPGSAFVLKMNQNAKNLGLSKTYFYNESGLDESGVRGGAYGSARDIVKLFEYALRNHLDLLEVTAESSASMASLSGVEHEVYNTNKIVGKIPGIFASKTGYSELAGGNLAIAFDRGLMRPIIVVVLGSTAADRFTDVEKLSKAVLQL